MATGPEQKKITVLTTKGAKSTKFYNVAFRILRGLHGLVVSSDVVDAGFILVI